LLPEMVGLGGHLVLLELAQVELVVQELLVEQLLRLYQFVVGKLI
jgi:hypothetical protein